MLVTRSISNTWVSRCQGILGPVLWSTNTLSLVWLGFTEWRLCPSSVHIQPQYSLSWHWGILQHAAGTSLIINISIFIIITNGLNIFITMPYLIVRESYLNNSCLVDGLPLNEVRTVTEKSSCPSDLRDEKNR